MIHGVGTIRSNLHFEDGVGARSADSFDAKANTRQVLGELSVIDRQVGEIANPLWRKFQKSAPSF
jgi:hypothetical protein